MGWLPLRFGLVAEDKAILNFHAVVVTIIIIPLQLFPFFVNPSVHWHK